MTIDKERKKPEAFWEGGIWSRRRAEAAARTVVPAREGEGCKPNLTCPAAGPIPPHTTVNANEDDYRAIVTSVRRGPQGAPLAEAQFRRGQPAKLAGDNAAEHDGPRLEAPGNPVRPASPSPHTAHRWRQRPGRSPPDSPSRSFRVGSPVDPLAPPTREQPEQPAPSNPERPRPARGARRRRTRM
ncbi:unnamed protein product [Rangifer tarandus platyrhynchus]|uniref:Uncharacterized protein n=1 Tax=Rangifer tarandus platyrhynchus TaxID=3082113 RepID=A0AC59YKR6_RANTA